MKNVEKNLPLFVQIIIPFIVLFACLLIGSTLLNIKTNTYHAPTINKSTQTVQMYSAVTHRRFAVHKTEDTKETNQV